MTASYNFFDVSNWPSFCASIGLLAGAVWLSRKVHLSRPRAALMSLLVLSLCLLNVFYYLADAFTGAGINAAVWFHLFSAFNTLGLSGFIPLITVGVVLLLVSIAASIHCYRSCRRYPESKHGSVGSYLVAMVGCCVAAGAVSPATSDVWRHSKTRAPIDEIAVYETPAIETDGSKPLNFIYIYAESLEQTFLDEARFPGLVPGLKALQNKSLVFTHINQVWGTEWSAAGIVASHCGVPLAGPTGFWDWDNRLSIDMPDFYSGATCLGDLLKNHGYRLSFLSGANLKFHGIGDFLRTHQVDVVDLWSTELPELLGKGVREVPWSPWGLFDDTLFGAATTLLKKRAKAKGPFGIFIETADTHNPAGHPTPSCKNIKYGDGKEPILNSVACADYLISKFVETVQADPSNKDTLIIIASDHLMQRNTVTPRLKKMRRSNLFMVLDPKNPRKNWIDKTGSMLDVGPTLLPLLGFDARLALGRDLLGKRASLFTQIKDFSRQLEEWKPYFRALWQYPKINGDIIFKEKAKAVLIGRKTISFPVFIEFNESLQTSVYQKLHNPHIKDVLGNLYKKSKAKPSPFIWVDQCSELAKFFGRSVGRRPVGLTDAQLRTKPCYVVGLSGRQDHILRPIEGQSTLGVKELHRTFKFPSLKRLISAP